MKTQEPNPILQLLKQKEATQKAAKNFGFFGKSKPSAFSRPSNSSRPTHRGGRNGHGKP
tara:strand:- start:23380 stop:23556 length:177 start_codon:yes stop_codon:yes gene_type:complete